MSLASHLKVKMESERSAALALDKAAEAFRTGSTQVLNDVRGGFERATWYGSCLFDRYNDVCSELNNENKRFFLSISEVYKRNDVILDMVKIYLNYELDKVDGKNNLIQELDKKIAGVLSSYQVGNVTKTAIANSVAVLICRSLKFNDFVLKNINRAALIFVTFF